MRLKKTSSEKHAIDDHDHAKVIVIFLWQQGRFLRWKMELSDEQRYLLVELPEHSLV